MRPSGLILMILGVLVLSIHSVTYFTTEHVVGPLGFLAWDVSKPHTIFFNPIAGVIALVLGVALLVTPRHTTSM